MGQCSLAGKGSTVIIPRVLILLALLLLTGCAGLSGPSDRPGWITVQRGDTLSGIARQAGIPLLRLQRFNPGTSARQLRVGQQLLLPGGDERAPGNGRYRYRIRPGDTISAIARRFNSSVADIRSANARLDDQHLAIGHMITVPVGKAASSGSSRRARPAPTRQPARQSTEPLPSGVGNWPWPLQGGSVKRHFGPDQRGQLQPMIIAAGRDRTARAVAAGTVRFAGTMRHLGGVIIVHHEHNLQTVYAQCDQLKVQEGKRISTGTPICSVANSASTGRFDLLFDIRHAGRPVNPDRLLK
ncbi:LysM domain-containing protein [Kushneria sinocarnis]|uniref:LysM domain-containing protein n=1 Tax=Kushneria sinocarnis TaxID=595502 RepID=A0A420WY75_9GAMM|nr:M23 family metallopeptidase [Kushneria sinocarnis]RKR06143.1 LysM domain-containing protein [Kushneria sinocarnis]